MTQVEVVHKMLFSYRKTMLTYLPTESMYPTAGLLPKVRHVGK